MAGRTAFKPSASPSPPPAGPAPSVFAPLNPARPAAPAPAAPPAAAASLLSLSSLPPSPPSHPSSLPSSLPPSLAHCPPIPSALPPALFAALGCEDEHVTVWHPSSGKTVAGNAAPYRRNLATWLSTHAGWEEKADELKSSKRRSASRRARAAAHAFASMCTYPVCDALIAHAGPASAKPSLENWSTDEFVRLQEALFALGQEAHASVVVIPANAWATVAHAVSRPLADVVSTARELLVAGRAKAVAAAEAHHPAPSAPASLPSSLDTFLDRSFRSPREPRITVWDPETGRTVSGNAAPCRSRLQKWLDQHPGWEAKSEAELSSSRRARKAVTDPVPVPAKAVPPPLPHPRLAFSSPALGSAITLEAHTPQDSPVFNAALAGLLAMSGGGGGGGGGGHVVASRAAGTSSVSSASSRFTGDDAMNDDADDDDDDDDVDDDDDDDDDDDVDADAMAD